MNKQVLVHITWPNKDGALSSFLTESNKEKIHVVNVYELTGSGRVDYENDVSIEIYHLPNIIAFLFFVPQLT